MGKDVWKVLIVDDEEGIRKVMSIALRDAGYDVLTAANGSLGLEACRKESPQIVITDIRMPDIDGMEVLKRIKKEDPNKEVIVITAFGEMDLAIEALQLDASDFITKPINDDALFVAIERAKSRFKTRKELQDYTVLLEEKWMTTAEELARTFNFQKNLIESSIDGIMGCDRDGKVITFNRGLEKILGFSKDDVIGKRSFDEFFPPGVAKQVREALFSDQYGGKNRLFLYETNALSRDGEKVPVQLSATVLFEGGDTVGIVGFFRDLREIKLLEQQFADQSRLLHQDKMMSLGRLAASVVHEINNPLAGILNYLKLMIKIMNRGDISQEHKEKFRRYLHIVESETERCSKIVSNLLAFSRKSEMEFSEININDLLERCIMLSQHKLILQNIRIKTDLDANMPHISADFNQIQQCVINLIFNAADAMPEGGQLTIKSALSAGKREVEFMIQDTGAGIAKDDLPRIFDPFYTTKMEGQGLGLGLSTVNGIIERHKGAIHVDSEPEKGTTFTVHLPLQR